MRAVLRFLWHRLTGVATGLMIGSAAAADLVARRLSTHPETRLRLVGYLGPEDAEPAKELPRLGSPADIASVAGEYDVERVVVTEQGMSEQAAEALIEECKAAGLGLTFLPRHFGLLGPGIELNRLAELPVLDFRFSDPPRSTMALKGAMDAIVSGTLLVLLSPLLLAIAIAILIDTGRPVFFRQRRAGKGGRPFTMVKFRTMSADAEERLGELVDLEQLEEPAFKIEADPRVTRSGRFLRRTSLDELPQLFNVLVGDMSLVGPRPEEEAVVALYDERQRARLAIRPGLTGPDAGLRARRPHLRGAAGDGARLPRQPLGHERRRDPAADAAGDHPRRGRPLSAMDLETIVVSHGAEDLLRRCLRSLEEHPASGETRVTVVDSGSADSTPEMVEREFPRGAADPPRQHRLLGRQQPRPARGGRRRRPPPQPRHRGLRGDARHRPRQAALRPRGSGWSGASW